MEGLITFDVSDPADPKRLGDVPLTIFSQGVPGQRQLTVQDGRVILANQNQGLLQVDASNPQAPALVGALDAPLSGSAFDAAVSSGTAYVTRDFIGLGSVQVSDPANPSYGNSETSFVKGAPVRTSWKLAVQGGYSYFNGRQHGFPGRRPQFLRAGGRAEGAAQVEQRGPAGTRWPMRRRPSTIRRTAIPRRGAACGSSISPTRWRPSRSDCLKWKTTPRRSRLDGDTLFYADMLEIKQESEGEFSAFHVIDISNPAAPVQVGEVDTTGQCQVAFAVVLSGDYAFIGDQKTGLCVIDIRDRTDPRLVLNWQEMPAIYDLALVGERIFAANYSHVSAINISDPLSPVLEDLTITPGLSWGIDAAGEFVYIADMDGGLNILGYR